MNPVNQSRSHACALRLSANVAQAVAGTTLVDNTRSGQFFFHWFNRTVQLDSQAETMRARSLNQNSQHIFFDIVEAGEKNLSGAPTHRTGSVTVDPDAMQRPSGARAGTSFEPFELHYLQALSDEGVDLHAFLDNWRRAMSDDLERLAELRREGGVDRLNGVLHRLSGAVGLVGARNLMAALRRASSAPQEHNANSIDELIERTRSLITQLENAVHAYWSTSR
jgi:HPt (histidine-containing phosphotransfer) domain-containing protein